MRSWWPWVLVGAGGLFALSRSTYSFGGPPLQTGTDRDPKNLLPAFASKVELLFQAMRARGFSPLLWEGRRTPARAAALAKQGVGIADSMHDYGAAVDIVDESTAPRYWDGKPGFWTALGQEAKKLGLTWGGDWTKRDLPHVQALAVKDEVAFRKLTPAAQAQSVA